jgi:hypothetical protein
MQFICKRTGSNDPKRIGYCECFSWFSSVPTSKVAANILKKLADSRQGVILQLGGLGKGLTTPHLEKTDCYEMLHMRHRNW